MEFKLTSGFSPQGDQPEAIAQLADGIARGVKHQTLLGVTGSGKTFTMANVVQKIQLPTLVISHNKTLAAQLYQEFRDFFPDNAVEYFVSFYDYYQPEAYLPSTDTYIEKTSEINDEIDRLRLKATSSLMSRRDVLIVASVSCIYNIGSPDSYAAASMVVRAGDRLDRRDFMRRLMDMRYGRNDQAFERGTFRVRGDHLDIYPAYEETAIRIQTLGDRVEKMFRIKPLVGKKIGEIDGCTIFPAKHFVSTRVDMESALAQIDRELQEQLALFRAQGKLVEAQRLEQRTRYDIEMLREVGFINGIENYSRILDGRALGSRPFSLIDFFKPPFLTIIDESHVSIPQIGGMFNGDRNRKQTLVDHGFRIPCALDNRPLRFEEFEGMTDFVIYSSATPADYELRKSEGIIVEQVIRPTGLVDPPVEIKPAENQVDDLVEQLRSAVEAGHRALVTTLTKKMSEDLSEYLATLGFRVRYLHSEIETIERSDILRDLRKGEFDILVGINLLREGLDLPEVALVAILDADKEGFLRSARSIIQIAGRAARNIDGRIILYADTMTDSIKKAVEETTRRRMKQLEFNQQHGITPRSIRTEIRGPLATHKDAENVPTVFAAGEPNPAYGARRKRGKSRTSKIGDTFALLEEMEEAMREAAAALEFEKAARLRDEIAKIRAQM
jgi:excinuclease ABC subunit B